MGLTKRLIPQILIRDGRAVKGMQFALHRRIGNPVTLARILEAQGADEIMIMEIDSNYQGLLKVVSALGGECAMPLVAGGGIRSAEEALGVIREGADGVSLGEPGMRLTGEIGDILGKQAVTASVDYKGCITAGGRYLPSYLGKIWPCVGEILLTSIDREGTRMGLDIPSLNEARRIVGCPLIGAGGASGADDIRGALEVCDGIAIGTLLAFSNQSYPELVAGVRSG